MGVMVPGAQPQVVLEEPLVQRGRWEGRLQPLNADQISYTKTEAQQYFAIVRLNRFSGGVSVFESSFKN
jgi:hypothetical protein